MPIMYQKGAGTIMHKYLVGLPLRISYTHAQ